MFVIILTAVVPVALSGSESDLRDYDQRGREAVSGGLDRTLSSARSRTLMPAGRPALPGIGQKSGMVILPMGLWFLRWHGHPAHGIGVFKSGMGILPMELGF